MKVQVTSNELLKIKTAFDSFSPVSLLANLSGKPGQVDEQQLKEQHLYNDEGLTEEAKALFSRLNQARKVERTILLTPIGHIQRAVYHFASGPVISVNQKADKYIIEDPGEVEKSLAIYSDIFGTSDTMVTAFDYQVTEVEALVLAGLMDLRIEAGLSVLLGLEPKEILTIEDLGQYFAKPRMNNRLAPLVYGLMESDLYQIPQKLLAEALESLVAKGCVELEGDEIAIAEAIIIMADGLMVFNSVLTAESYLVGEKGVFGEKAVILYGSPTTILRISKSSGGIRFTTITGHDLMEILL